MLRFSAAIFLAQPRARANGRYLKSVVVPSDGGRYSYATSAAPQDYPLGTNVPTGKEANYPFKLDALTISIIGMSRSEIRYYTPAADLSNSSACPLALHMGIVTDGLPGPTW